MFLFHYNKLRVTHGYSHNWVCMNLPCNFFWRHGHFYRICYSCSFFFFWIIRSKLIVFRMFPLLIILNFIIKIKILLSCHALCLILHGYRFLYIFVNILRLTIAQYKVSYFTKIMPTDNKFKKEHIQNNCFFIIS